MTKPIGVILAGGRSQRLHGEDKGLILINKAPMISFAITRLKPQVSEIIISANRNQEAYKQFGYQVVSDVIDNFHGPLSGLLSAMDALLSEGKMKMAQSSIFLTACDMPDLPTDFIDRISMYSASSSQQQPSIYIANDGVRRQPLCSYIPLSLRDDLAAWLSQGNRKVEDWFSRLQPIDIDYSSTPDAFVNLNTDADIKRFESRLNPD